MLQLNNNTPISVIKGISYGQHSIALKLFWNAFFKKLRFALGFKKKALIFLEHCIDLKHTRCAIRYFWTTSWFCGY